MPLRAIRFRRERVLGATEAVGPGSSRTPAPDTATPCVDHRVRAQDSDPRDDLTVQAWADEGRRPVVGGWVALDSRRHPTRP